MWWNLFYFLAEDIRKLCDPLYTESDNLVPETVKFQLLQAEEEKMKEALSGLQKIESLKSVLDSQPIQGKTCLLYIFCSPVC